MIQSGLVILAVLAAGVYLGRQIYKRFFSKKSSCEGCAMGKMDGNNAQ